MLERRSLHALAMGLGIAGLASLELTAQLLSPNHLYLYHLPGPASRILIPVILDVLYLWLGAFAYLLLATFTNDFVRRILWLVLLSVLSFALYHNISFLLQQFQSRPFHTNDFHSLALSLAVFVVLLALLLYRHPWFDQVCRISSTMLIFTAIFGASCLLQLVALGFQSRSLNTTHLIQQQASPVAPAATNSGKVIWILFDELSYQQVYGHRYAGLQLPTFDQLHAQAVVFSHTEPAGYFTEKAVPSMMMGTEITELKSTADGWPLFKTPTDPSWQRLDPEQTVFGDAYRAQLRTGIAGWYNPYCRIFGSLTDFCFWTLQEQFQHHMRSNASILENSVAPWKYLLNKFGYLVENHHAMPLTDLSSRTEDYEKLLNVSDSLLKNPQLSFVFLHLPLPHPLGFYNRHTGTLSAHGTYIDNLALCDKTLAHLRNTLIQEHAWDSSTIILMGDHSWRIPIWRGQPGWTSEEERASKGIFDDRPAYIVKLPNQHTGYVDDKPYSALRTRALIDQLLSQKIQTPQQLIDWANTAHS